MPRLHGERVQDFWARRAGESLAAETTARYLAGPRPTIEVAVACCCRDFPMSHEHTRAETVAMLRRRGVSPEKYLRND